MAAAKMLFLLFSVALLALSSAQDTDDEALNQDLLEQSDAESNAQSSESNALPGPYDLPQGDKGFGKRPFKRPRNPQDGNYPPPPPPPPEGQQRGPPGGPRRDASGDQQRGSPGGPQRGPPGDQQRGPPGGPRRGASGDQQRGSPRRQNGPRNQEDVQDF
ncbi:proline-rich proteoglycan 2-like [Gracilinanus agilis]|uniref:proline-rich proteoglycan 2-like n=1 Tax=Gracilinanus agilis TaxID=191870 RepID=UPI001CFD2ACC|nr:proline-rich proteoglycan 2-like [Gracilinanus agilis]